MRIEERESYRDPYEEREHEIILELMKQFMNMINTILRKITFNTSIIWKSSYYYIVLLLV